jgi:hypothetical protein
MIKMKTAICNFTVFVPQRKANSGENGKKLLRDESKVLGDENHLLRDENKFVGDENHLLRDENKFIGDENHLLRDETHFFHVFNRFGPVI